MQNLLSSTGTILGILGALICLTAGVTRVLGAYYLLGVAATTIFIVGNALMVLACLLKLEVLLSRSTKQ